MRLTKILEKLDKIKPDSDIIVDSKAEAATAIIPLIEIVLHNIQITFNTIKEIKK